MGILENILPQGWAIYPSALKPLDILHNPSGGYYPIYPCHAHYIITIILWFWFVQCGGKYCSPNFDALFFFLQVFNWSEVHLYQIYFLQNPFFRKVFANRPKNQIIRGHFRQLFVKLRQDDCQGACQKLRVHRPIPPILKSTGFCLFKYYARDWV